ncbi:MAG: ABC transporter ATP-binding protein, partial [Candidatus Rokuibacteriota bacterium]
MLEVRGLTKSFDGFVAVSRVSFDVAKGSVCAIIGPNGAGKTTLFNLITGHLRCDAAFLSHRGRGWNLFTPVRDLYRDETLRLLDSLGLADRAGEIAGFLSHGAQKQLELGLALALEPDILLLDEPTAGMSAGETRETIRLVDRIARERGLTLLFTEHDMEVVFSIAQKITVLHQGRVIADGSPADVRADAEVR